MTEKCPNERCNGTLNIYQCPQYTSRYCTNCGFENRTNHNPPLKLSRPRFPKK